MEIKNKNYNFRSDLIREYTKKYYKLNNILLHFCDSEHDKQYKDVWQDIKQNVKDEWLNYFIGLNDKKKNIDKLRKLYLIDSNLNNINIKKFDIINKYELINLFNLKSYALYLNACLFKGMLREFLKTENSKDNKIKVYCVQDYNLKGYEQYIYLSDNKKDVEKYLNNNKFKIWEE